MKNSKINSKTEKLGTGNGHTSNDSPTIQPDSTPERVEEIVNNSNNNKNNNFMKDDETTGITGNENDTTKLVVSKKTTGSPDGLVKSSKKDKKLSNTKKVKKTKDVKKSEKEGVKDTEHKDEPDSYDTEVKTEVVTKNIDDLTIHPIHTKLYGDNENIDDIKLSMEKEKQSLTPIIVTNNNEIVSGVRRYLCYKELKLKTIDVIVKDIKPENILMSIFTSNIQRKNTCLQTLNIYDSLMEYYSHQGKKTSDSNETEGDELTRNKVCKMIGWSVSNINKLKKIKDFNSDLLTKIDDGTKTIHKCSKMCKKNKTDLETIIYDNLNVPNSKLFQVRKYDKSSKMDSVKDMMIQCIVTTPPKYTGETEVKQYCENLTDRFEECHRMLKDEGSLYLIMNDFRKESGVMSNIPHILLTQLTKKIGFHHVDTIIWKYSTPPPNGNKDKYLVQSFKYIFHLTKRMDYYTNEVGRNIRMDVLPENPNGNSKTEIYDKYRFYKGKEWNKEWISENIVQTNNTEVVDNKKPSSIMETVPIGLILDSTKDGDTVLNPFSSDESVGLVSLFYDRKYIGYTDNEEYSKIQSVNYDRFLNECKKV